MRYAGLGFQLLGSIAVFGWIGNYIDTRLNLAFPAFLLSFILLSFGVNMFLIYRSLTNKNP